MVSGRGAGCQLRVLRTCTDGGKVPASNRWLARKWRDSSLTLPLASLSGHPRRTRSLVPCLLPLRRPTPPTAMAEDTPRASSSTPYPPPALSSAPSASSLKVRSSPHHSRPNLTSAPPDAYSIRLRSAEALATKKSAHTHNVTGKRRADARSGFSR